MSNPWPIRCGHCGRFCTPADEYTIWGTASYDPPEPHDPTPVCAACLPKFRDKLVARILREGIPTTAARPYWQSPSVWADVVRHHKALRRHGLWTPPERHEEARSAWRGGVQFWTCAVCGKPERHPDHGQDPRYPKRCWRFQRSVGTWIVPREFTLWCVCGWTTGWWRMDRAKEAARALPEPRPWWARASTIGGGPYYVKYLLGEHVRERRNVDGVAA